MRMLGRLINSLKTLVKMTGVTLVDQILVSGSNFAVAIYLARVLGLEEFGQYGLILAIGLLCHELQRSLVSSPMMVFAAKGREQGYFHGVRKLQILASIVLAGGAGMFILFSDMVFKKWHIAGLAVPAGIFIFTKLQQDFKRRYFFTSKQALKALISDSVATIILVTGLIYGHTQLSVSYVLYVLAISYAVASVTGFITREETKNSVQTAFNKHWHYSKWLLASSVTTFAAGDMIFLVTSAILGNKAAGIVKIGQYAMGGMFILFQAMENIIPNKLSALVHAGDMRQTKAFFFRFVALLLTICAAHGVFILCFLDIILQWLSHGDYPPVQYTIAVLYLVFSATLCMNYAFNYLLRAYENTKPIFYASLTSAIFNLSCASWLIHRHGVIGVMACLFIVQFIICGFYLHAAWKPKR